MRLTEKDMDRLLVEAWHDPDPHVYAFIFLGLNTGMRHGEIVSLNWTNIDLLQSKVWVPRAKAGPRYVYLTEPAKEFLKRLRASSADEQQWLFPAARGEGHRGYIRTPFDRCVAKAGLGHLDVTPHTMRHTFISRLVEAEVSQGMVQRLSGHRSPSMTDRYFHPQDDRLIEAVARVGVAGFHD